MKQIRIFLRNFLKKAWLSLLIEKTYLKITIKNGLSKKHRNFWMNKVNFTCPIISQLQKQ